MPKAIVLRSFDPVAIDLAETHLRAAEIPFVRIGRGNAAMLGVGDSAIEQLIEVDADDAEQARQLLAGEALEAEADADAEPASDADGGEPAATDAESKVSAKARFIGGGLALLWPGLGMAYAGFPLTGLAVAAWSFLALGFVMTDPLAFTVFGGVVPRIVDLAGTQYWLRRFGRRGPSAIVQAVLAIALVGGSALGVRYLSDFLWSAIPEGSFDIGYE